MWRGRWRWLMSFSLQVCRRPLKELSKHRRMDFLADLLKLLQAASRGNDFIEGACLHPI